jgi:hypothetical protein
MTSARLPPGRLTGRAASLVQAFAVLIAAGIGSGCSNECNAGQVECTGGNAIRRCVGGSESSPLSPRTWETSPCGAPDSYCVLAAPNPGATPVPTCVSSPTPASACSGVQNEACVDNATVGCVDGYPFGPAPCTDTCVAVPGYAGGCAYCGDGPAAADPTCADGGISTCFNGSVFACACRERAGMTTNCGVDAGGPGACATAYDSTRSGVRAFCALAATPDPRCPDGGSALCSEDASVECSYGYAVCPCSGDGGACTP